MVTKRKEWRSVSAESSAVELYKPHDLIARQLKKHLGNLRGKRIMDLGCGSGVLLKKLSDEGAEAHGIDAHWENIAACRKLGLKNLVKGDVSKLYELLPKKLSFDAVVSSLVLEEPVLSLHDTKRVIEQAHERLTPDGVQMHFVDNPGNIKELFRAKMIDVKRIAKIKEVTRRFWRVPRKPTSWFGRLFVLGKRKRK